MSYLSFRLKPSFTAPYATKPVPWGFGVLSEVTFLRTYARKKEDGSKERFHEVCERVTNGTYSILKDWCQNNVILWDEEKAHRSAEEFFDRLFNLKWSPPGRGLWTMGTAFVHERKNSAPLQNCAFVDTADKGFIRAMAFLFEASMLGVGVGFNTSAAGKYTIHQPVDLNGSSHVFEIPDTREGWVESTSLLLESYLSPNQHTQYFDYSALRPEGADIKGFGGKAAGPEPLKRLHERIRALFDGRHGERLTEVDVADIGNLIGRCVVAGNVRRSAEIFLGQPTDTFLNLKNPDVFPERNDWTDGWSHLSNNSVYAKVGDTDYDTITPRISANGEPGFFYLDLARDYGRLIDPPTGRDYRAVGTNPCGEQTLESFECCTLVETYPTRCDNKMDYLRTLKFAYLYAKAVTLLPTHWPETNAIMQRNRRIGTSMTGIAQFVENNAMTTLRSWQDDGYATLSEWDRVYSEWLCIRESIKKTSVKPSGTVSLLAGVTPGVHWPTHGTYIRRMRIAANDPLLSALAEAGYHVEPDVKDPEGTYVVEFPVKGLEGVRTEREVSIWEKTALAVLTQRYWADNQVSCTITFSKEERADIPNVLHTHEGQLKSLSMLPIFEEADPEVYPQLPYQSITDDQYRQMVQNLREVDLQQVYAGGLEASGERYCSTDKCELTYETGQEQPASAMIVASTT